MANILELLTKLEIELRRPRINRQLRKKIQGGKNRKKISTNS